MKNTIKELLNRHSVIHPKLLQDLNELFEVSMKVSRELGKRSSFVEMSPEETTQAWIEIRYAVLGDFKNEYGVYGPIELEKVKNKYKLYSKNNEIQSTRIDRKTSGAGYSMQPFLKPMVTEKGAQLSIASVNELPFRKDVDG